LYTSRNSVSFITIILYLTDYKLIRSLGLRFGMTGRFRVEEGKRRRFGLIIDQEQDILRIVHSSLTYFPTLSVILNAANP
jgi:hypothetical protein